MVDGSRFRLDPGAATAARRPFVIAPSLPPRVRCHLISRGLSRITGQCGRLAEGGGVERIGGALVAGLAAGLAAALMAAVAAALADTNQWWKKIGCFGGCFDGCFGGCLGRYE